jgi:hypothetical protein
VEDMVARVRLGRARIESGSGGVASLDLVKRVEKGR